MQESTGNERAGSIPASERAMKCICKANILSLAILPLFAVVVNADQVRSDLGREVNITQQKKKEIYDKNNCDKNIRKLRKNIEGLKLEKMVYERKFEQAYNMLEEIKIKYSKMKGRWEKMDNDLGKEWNKFKNIKGRLGSVISRLENVNP